ncbi:hypothetical protein FIBSPDRAFT_939379, partial [Athelia psychrophila]
MTDALHTPRGKVHFNPVDSQSLQGTVYWLLAPRPPILCQGRLSTLDSETPKFPVSSRIGMASSSDASTSKSYEVTAVEATGLASVRFKFGRSLSTSIQIDAGNLSWTTPGVPWKNNGIIRWDDKIIIPPSARSTKVTFSLFRGKTLIGRAEIDLTEALAKSELHLNEDAVVSLQRKDKEIGRLTVRV